MCVFYFRVFNFCRLSNWQTIFNTENIPIYNIIYGSMFMYMCACVVLLSQSSVPGGPAKWEAEQYDARVEHLQWKDGRNN